MPEMTITELSEHFKLNKRTLQTLYYRRSDCPAPVGSKPGRYGGKPQPTFDVKQFESHLQELGLIERNLSKDKMTFIEVRELLDVSYTHLKYLQRTDPKFPKTLTDKSFRMRMANWVFLRAEIEAYKKRRPKYKDRLKVSPKPIKATGNKRNDVINFLSAPSPLRPRKKTTGEAKTTRIRTEGVVGVW
jgi:hypothetical protein